MLKSSELARVAVGSRPIGRPSKTTDTLPHESSVDLSVILPNFNHAAYVGGALDALLAQEPDEILVIDDGSQDTSVALLKDYAAKNSRIRLFLNRENCGVVQVSQQGFAAARGRYICFAAADDQVMPDFFARGLKLLDEHGTAGLFCADALAVDGRTMHFVGCRPPVRPRFRAGFTDADSARRMLAYMDNWILTSSTLFRRSAVVEAGGLDPDLGPFADGYLARRIAITSGFCYAPIVASTYRIFPSGFSQTTALNLERARLAGERVSQKMSRDPAFPDWYPELFRQRWHFATARLAIEAQPPNRPLLVAMGARTPADRKILSALVRLPGIARVAVLAWLWYRWRPYRLLGLMATALQRLMERWLSVAMR